MLKFSSPFRLLVLITILGFVAIPSFADEAVPDWMQTAMRQNIPIYDKDVPGVVLQNEQTVTLGSNGNLVITTNYAVKILLREAKKLAVAGVPYLQSSGKVRELKAWLVRPNGTVHFLGKGNIVDMVSDPEDIYNEYRVRFIDASRESDAGVIFGYQSTVEERPLFYQDVWDFQERLPTLVSRYTLNLPNNWKAQSITFNHPKLEPTVSGTSYSWELRDMSPIPPESLSPSVRNLAPQIAINYAPENASSAVNRAFSDWHDVSRWTTEMHDAQVIVDDNVAAKARELTVNAKTEFEKIQAIGRFVQNMQYISVDIGIGYGNGYRPRPSNLVLQRGYGDCKDKANLMRALLRALKIEAYPIAIFAGDPTFTRAEWVSPRQFNHCIIAIKVGSETNAPTVINHPVMGKLLIFDATAQYTQIGDLPEYEQGSFALIAAGNDGDLVKMPVLPPEMNKLERKAEVNLNETGGLSGLISEHSVGQSAALEREMFRSIPATEYNKHIENWIGNGISSAKIAKITPTDDPLKGIFDLTVEFSATSYGQVYQNRLLVFKPALVSRLELSEGKRFNAVILDSTAYSETVKINLPKGFVVDETPDAVNLETSFGKYTAAYEVKDGQLIFTRALTLQRTSIPSEKYDSVRTFFKQIRVVEQAPVVLLRK